jgi:hypothetical protein
VVIEGEVISKSSASCDHTGADAEDRIERDHRLVEDHLTSIEFAVVKDVPVGGRILWIDSRLETDKKDAARPENHDDSPSLPGARQCGRSGSSPES